MNTNEVGTLNAGYDLTYTYQDSTGHKFQLANVQDVNYRTEGTPTDSTNINNSHAYEYDANGNLVYVNTSRTKKDGIADEKAAERKFKWDEENRLLAADENGFVSNYWYDADGERTVKTSGEGEQIYVNSEFAGGRTNTAKFSLYVSPYLVANQGGRYTKHIYIGSQRIVSKLGDFASYGSDPRRIAYAGSEADAVTVDYKAKYIAQQQVIKDNYATFNVPYNGEDNNDYVDGESFCCNDGSMEVAQAKAMAANAAGAKANNFHDADTYEKMQFYYHPDHLGSSSYITNLDGEVAQHIEYVPFGEVFIEERNNTWNTPYLFNAKEFDEETGLYYYGARYYEPRLSLWMSTDPLSEKYPNISGYVYCSENPIRFADFDGRWFWEKNGNLHAEKNDNTKTMAEFLGTSQKNALEILHRNKIRTGKKGRIKVGNLSKLSLDKNSLYVMYADKSGIVLEDNIGVALATSSYSGSKAGAGPHQNTLAVMHYYFGKGESADVGDYATALLMSTKRFRENLNAATTQKKGNDKITFSVDMTTEVFHIGRTPVTYRVFSGNRTSHVEFYLYQYKNGKMDSFSDPLDIGREIGGTPYDYKLRTVTYFFRPVR